MKKTGKYERKKFEFNLNTAPIVGIGIGAVFMIIYLFYRFIAFMILI